MAEHPSLEGQAWTVTIHRDWRKARVNIDPGPSPYRLPTQPGLAASWNDSFSP